MTVVAKLGSSIVADDGGELRAAVLDSVCAQVAELHAGGENVVLVTSGAIARGMRLMELRGAAAARSTSCRRRRRSARARCFAPTRSGSPRAERPRRAGAADRVRHRRADALPERAPDAAPAARLARRAGRQRERHDRDRRDHVRRQRLPLGAGGDPARGAAAGPADRHRGAAHRRPAPRPRTPS